MPAEPSVNSLYISNSSVLAWGNKRLIAIVSTRVGISAIINKRIRIICQYFLIKLTAVTDILAIEMGSAITIYFG